ncbi:unnamed protein product [Kuraishia capsulata CBS 1993]|uniref:Major facilitator superfamily (MFS) profile domain-containing protein n=1 Tax=Kuraishia capsulata CBS 1993 TaxID=1382522 RepID=W6MJY9_9ASCO|nr:uncharacterized protein KUCA_T00000839001 [Kuraishia capsulata CBS 1993]CDK24872.1 unnamed protein product [Kuraishia capsulata CBS 1993]
MKTKISFREQLAGFPVWQTSVISMIRFSEPIAFTSLFPYMYFMVKDFGVAETDEDISKYCGYISSAFAFFQFLCSVHWGHYADVIGRKPVLLIGLLGTGCSMLAFGFSSSFWMAFASRAFMGAINGNVAVIRTMLGEVASDPRHTALALSLVPLLWQVGCIIGPLSGYLVNTDRASSSATSIVVRDTWMHKSVSYLVPLAKRSAFHEFTEKYPYALSNIVVAYFIFSSLLIAILFLEETHETLKYRRDYGLEIGDRIRRHFGYTVETRSWNRYTRVTENDIHFDTYELNSSASNVSESGSGTENQMGTKHQKHSDTSYPWRKLMTSKVFYALLSNFIMAFHTIVADELFPVFCSSSIARTDPSDPMSPLLSKFPHIVGGLGKDSKQVGNVLSITGLVGVIVVVFVYPYLDRKYDALTSYKALLVPFSAIYALIPFLVFTLTPNYPTTQTSMHAIYAISFAKTILGSLGFPQIFLLVHESAEPGYRAFINGMALSFTSFARFLAPTIWGTIMSFSQAHGIAWFTWWSLGAVAICGNYVTSFISPIAVNLDEHDDID